jgi:hypothetical protein
MMGGADGGGHEQSTGCELYLRNLEEFRFLKDVPVRDLPRHFPNAVVLGYCNPTSSEMVYTLSSTPQGLDAGALSCSCHSSRLLPPSLAPPLAARSYKHE